MGYNFQFGDALLGVEADYVSVNRMGSRFDSASGVFGGQTLAKAGSVETRLIDMFSFRGRAGYVMGAFMPYVTGGLAIGRGTVTNTVTASVTTPGVGTSTAGPYVEQRKNSASAGFVIGAGLEAMLGGVFVRGEYLYARMQPQGGTTMDVNQYRLGAGVKF